MGQKINPLGLRVGISRDWDAKWYAEKDYGTLLNEDLKVRSFISKRLADASVSRVEIERAANRVNISIHTGKPGMVIGKGGSEVETLRKQLNNLTGKRVHINIVEIKQPDLDAHLVGESITQQLEGRVAFRRAMKQAIQRTMRAGAHGIKTMVSGRLNGADIARKEMYSDGTVPLHTLRADIDYSWDEAKTTYGQLGVKTWIYRGDILPGQTHGDSLKDNAPSANNRGGNRRNNNRGGNRNNNGRNNNNRNNGAKGGN
ncbi:30S ribosomal protein S3 [Loigolactobacillus backii]|uniref:Small ribosomal subunit protein uS3 n=1 Tax=Loigolactobacillus backii TaxID=375175 RepID=A0A192H374_9LACO|nr:30S ribosomal protein S3 [Loigolactobacillus backii]ANK62411.1 30S ribosomal protein S3 [Loigolactobacillus backii]ANK65032.1 30S ribosomal protein S3 [Loigolactobacillus backii]ANK67589.1 30S ribosomal protein S3 [Loigolactobacillus backii]ANK70577.1 30S ribosomal protein S3 [Loigolactobacillus backii]